MQVLVMLSVLIGCATATAAVTEPGAHTSPNCTYCADLNTSTQCADGLAERHGDLPMKASRYGDFLVTPLSSALGAKVAGADGSPLNLTAQWDADSELREQISTLLLRHQVLVFHGQDLHSMTQLNMAKHWGPVPQHPLGSRAKDAADDGMPEGVVVLKNTKGREVEARNDMWHSDVSCVDHPAAVNLLYAADYEPLPGFGDTLFANMERAYEQLSSERQEALKGMDCYFSTHLFENDKPREKLKVSTGTYHPTVRSHPETCHDSLYISPVFFEHFLGMTVSESESLHAELTAVSTSPENTYRHRWVTGDLVIFDNRNTMHYAAFDYDEGQVRTMHSARSQMAARPFSKHRQAEGDAAAQWCQPPPHSQCA